MKNILLKFLTTLTLLSAVAFAQDKHCPSIASDDAIPLTLISETAYDSECLCAKMSMILDPIENLGFDECVQQANTSSDFRSWLIRSLENARIPILDCVDIRGLDRMIKATAREEARLVVNIDKPRPGVCDCCGRPFREPRVIPDRDPEWPHREPRWFDPDKDPDRPYREPKWFDSEKLLKINSPNKLY